ncbi:hypothetical protein H0I76_02345 [Limibaculum sp. M0105]|uniref:Uncharacterized protein n=1 Tax=Thermohalobaculum xanthum TaxID=2753746 RepID=A0A8J7M4G1_9RHOB|nr:hypothetical protein [Thermohalobaculum xanthum]MBK0398018.1 hypothetical protein [Thermohalobaculum xanthum]
MPTSELCRAGRSRARHLALSASVALALSGCLAVGESGLDAELERIRAIRGFAVVSASPEKAVLAARGRRVIVEPAPGSCIARDSIEVSSSLAFLIISDCVIEHAAALLPVTSDAIEIELPPAFPGVITVSVSGAPMDDDEGGGSEAVGNLRAYLETVEGKAQLGRGGDATMVEIEETRIVGDTLYVLVRDRSEDASPLLAPAFWRAFVEVNGRMVMATVSGFRDRPVGSEAMLRKLAAQVSALRAANGLDRFEAVAGELPAALPPDRENERATRIAPYLSPMVEPAPRKRRAKTVTAEVKAPSPPAAPASVDTGSAQAPKNAPAALRRPSGA